ncbi:NAD(P)H:quinone oxidoreductase [Spirochaeta africana]|uniref:NAD(P)H:quinone oxidoreductase, type IV n=1 Tax=Spirochaeta africana (strain ATCC 700263 / DSM 8902 / Z-7692) TaxID=889378 RepID=H9UFF3_SPIAZ|nr:NAD(P)H:quinone oxidoreductase [Spirochaeta africana]AFG36246.1 NAD(P)H:quinone oxidoreductase, type IV [Spirochaeta africana DSM 8902]
MSSQPKIKVLFYSTYGHMYQMAEAAAEGARQAGAKVELKRFPEIIPAEQLQAMGAAEAQKAFAHIPEAGPTDFEELDGLIIVTATRYSNIPGQVANILDQTGKSWAQQLLKGKVGGAIVGTGTQHGGQESAALTVHRFFLHMGMVVAGLPSTFQGMFGVDEVKGGTPYGATTVSGADGSRMPSEVELEAARYQAAYITELAGKLKG